MIYRVFTLLLVCQKKAMSLNEFSRTLKYLLKTSSVDIIVRDFNYVFQKDYQISY